MPVYVSPDPANQPRRVLVFGGRNFTNRGWLFEVLDAHHAAEPFACVIEGGQVSVDPAENGRAWAKRRKWGADFFAHQWASERGVSCHTVRADWKAYGKAAGPIRNQRMIDEFKPTLGIGFPGGRGTADMHSKLKAAGIAWIVVSRSASVGRNPEGEDREDGLRAQHEHAVPSEETADAQPIDGQG